MFLEITSTKHLLVEKDQCRFLTCYLVIKGKLILGVVAKLYSHMLNYAGLQ